MGVMRDLMAWCLLTFALTFTMGVLAGAWWWL